MLELFEKYNGRHLIVIELVYVLPRIRWMEKWRYKHSHGKEELFTEEKWCDRQSKRKVKRLMHTPDYWQLSALS